MAPAKLLVIMLVIWIVIFMVLIVFQKFVSRNRNSVGDRRRRILDRMRNNSPEI